MNLLVCWVFSGLVCVGFFSIVFDEKFKINDWPYTISESDFSVCLP
jgi:hypothetical protein